MPTTEQQFDRVERELSAIPKKLVRQALPGATRAAARVIASRARVLVPVRSGRLKESISVFEADGIAHYGDGRRVRARGVDAAVWAGPGTASGFSGGSQDYYALPVEVGTRRQAPQPFMERAVQGTKARQERAFINGFARGLPPELR